MAKYFRISPELVDGDHWSVLNADTLDGLFSCIRDWYEDDPYVGDSFTIEVIEMTDEEVEALPEI